MFNKFTTKMLDSNNVSNEGNRNSKALTSVELPEIVVSIDPIVDEKDTKNAYIWKKINFKKILPDIQKLCYCACIVYILMVLSIGIYGFHKWETAFNAGCMSSCDDPAISFNKEIKPGCCNATEVNLDECFQECKNQEHVINSRDTFLIILIMYVCIMILHIYGALYAYFRDGFKNIYRRLCFGPNGYCHICSCCYLISSIVIGIFIFFIGITILASYVKFNKITSDTFNGDHLLAILIFTIFYNVCGIWYFFYLNE